MKNRIVFIVVLIMIAFGAVIGTVLVLQAQEVLVLRSPVLTRDPSLFTYLEGQVEVRSATDGTEEWNDAEIGMKLREGDVIRTGINGLADIRIYDDGLMRLMSNTEISLDDATMRHQTVGISRGTLFAKFRLLFDSQELKFITPDAIAAVRGTELVFRVDSSGTEIDALSGITEISNPALPDDRILLAFQSTTSIRASSAPTDPVELSPGQVTSYSRIFNGIHEEEVFLISQDINFQADSATILEESLVELDEVARLLKLRRIDILIAGHTADIGNTSAQFRLSEQRAAAIREELIARGINSKRLSIVGYGGSKPLGDNKTPEGRAANRRVEFLVID
jgi:outer membrane protein OmpA-like peptidoglycan-associated protein